MDKTSRHPVVAIIPARGGSKGIPGKNIQRLAGKPLLAYSIEQAFAAPTIDRVIVSTDASSIAEVAASHGAQVITRPSEISGDDATSESALVHVLDCLSQSEGIEPALVVFLQATSPMRRPGDIEEAIQTLVREKADSLLSVAPLHGFIWRSERDSLRSLSYDYRYRQRRQDAPQDYIENGSIYIFKPRILRECNNRLGGKIAIHRMRALDSFQVDDPEDLELMEMLMSGNHREPARKELKYVRMLALDFDGVLTDNRVLVGQNGDEAVLCDRADGLGLELLKHSGIDLLILSRERNPVVARRAEKLGIEVVYGCSEKLPTLRSFCETRRIEQSQIAFIGNDINDLECLRWVGLPIAVADALPQVKAAARWVTTRRGGCGAVREVCDSFLANRNP